MSFDSFGDLLAMSGHGGYVWSSYALALGVVVLIIVAPLRRRRRFLAEQASRLKRGGTEPAGEPAATATGRTQADTP